MGTWCWAIIPAQHRPIGLAPRSAVDGDVDVVPVVGRVAPAVSHVAPALSVPLDVPDVLVPDHVLDAQGPRVGPGPGGDLLAQSLAGLRGVARDHQVERQTRGVI